MPPNNRWEGAVIPKSSDKYVISSFIRFVLPGGG